MGSRVEQVQSGMQDVNGLNRSPKQGEQGARDEGVRVVAGNRHQVNVN